MLCVTQWSSARVSPADMGPQAAVASVQVADAGDKAPGMTTAPEATLADLSSELAEPLAPVPAMLWPAMRAPQPAAPLRVALPQPLIEGPQRPPRA